RCDEQCPALISGKPLSPRLIMGKILDQVEDFQHIGSKTYKIEIPKMAETISADEIWACTTCMACVTNCPAYISPMDKIIEIRRGLVLQKGSLPGEAISVLRNMELYGDVNGKGPSRKADWALNRNVPHVSSSSNAPEALLWVGCSGAFNPEYQKTTRDFVKLLRAGGIDFSILAHEEFCCGDPARKLGDEALFLKLARQNIDRLRKYNISKIITLCPHCFNTLRLEYPVLGCDMEVLHAVEIVDKLIQDHRISLKYPFAKSLAVHDPCYLGRYNGIFEPLRRICRSVPGVIFKELDRNKSHGFCCGGGGGRMWLHENMGENINVLRAREVVAAGVDAIATACPYCLTMMEDGVKTVDEDNPPQVIDIIRLAADSVG
ncbi:(Fe-S)-binding protein, partial [Thermodesulfobacteriota bacterium]